MTIEVHPLSPDRLPDFLDFFDRDAFADNPQWSSCYCQCYYENHSRVIWKDRSEPTPDVGAVVCFIVAPRLRRRGVSSALLSAACDGLRSQGLRIAAANPRADAASAADNHFGPLAMYLAAGFAVHRTDSDGSVYVRKPL